MIGLVIALGVLAGGCVIAAFVPRMQRWLAWRGIRRAQRRQRMELRKSVVSWRRSDY